MTQNANPMLLDVIGNLNPTKAFYIQHEKGTAEILDLTAQLATLFTREIGITAASLVTAQSIATKKPPLPSAYQIFEDNFMGTRYSLKTSSGEVVANTKKNLLSFGKATFTFSPFAGQAELAPVEVKRSGFWRWSEEFVVDGVQFRGQTVVGENEPQQYDKVFLKMMNDRMVEVGRYSQKSKYMSGGLLVVDAKKMDERVAILMACYSYGV